MVLWLKFPFAYRLRESTQVLVRLRGCAGSPEPLLFAFAVRTLFARRGPIIRLPETLFSDKNIGTSPS